MIQTTGKTLGYIGCEGHDAVDIWSGDDIDTNSMAEGLIWACQEW